MDQENMTRKEFMRKLSMLGAGFVGAFSFLSSCKKSDKGEQEAKKEITDDPCGDLSALTEDEKATRDVFEYVAQSPYPEKLCDNCALWVEPEGENFCGGCEIMAGPIHPKGYCNAWIAVE
jgi:hypothetical protein